MPVPVSGAYVLSIITQSVVSQRLPIFPLFLSIVHAIAVPVDVTGTKVAYPSSLKEIFPISPILSE